MFEIDKIIEKYPKDKSSLIFILQDIQSKYNYLPKEALIKVSEILNVALPQVFHVATFYKAFSLKPRGKNIIKCCLGTACHLKGGPRIVEALERELKIKPGETTEDLKFTLETVNCVGACALAPVMIVQDKYYDKVTPTKAIKILKSLGEQIEEVKVKRRTKKT